MSKVELLNMVPGDARRQLENFMQDRGHPAYRIEQIMPHLWRSPVADFGDISTLPSALKDELAERFVLSSLQLTGEQHSIDGTAKFLFQLPDGQQIETVAIPDGQRITFCISSQAGCALQCAFCATGAMGFARNLTPFEIAGQVRQVVLHNRSLLPTNIVFMGMGEPLMNWRSVDLALTILNDPEGVGIGARHITVSTVGVLPGIEALAARREQFRLALSIHAPSDELRRQLMPVNIKYPLRSVLEAAANFSRRVTFEYVMLGGVNDLPEHAEALAKMARECGAFVNLIPLHPGGAGSFSASSPQAISSFARAVRRHGVETAIRKSRGMDIAAACGQLRAERTRRGLPISAQHDGDVHKSA